MTIERREMNGCWDLNPIREVFYKPFLMKVERRKSF
jgi:hypothetical protein